MATAMPEIATKKVTPHMKRQIQKQRIKTKKLIEESRGKKKGLKNALTRGKGKKLGIYKKLGIEVPEEEIPKLEGIEENVIEIVNELVNGEKGYPVTEKML